jgi:hypothetical protein
MTNGEDACRPLLQKCIVRRNTSCRTATNPFTEGDNRVDGLDAKAARRNERERKRAGRINTFELSARVWLLRCKKTVIDMTSTVFTLDRD